MAEVDNYLTDGSEGPAGALPVGTAGDFAKTLGVGTAAVGSNLAAALRYGWELGGSENGADIAQGLQKIFGATGETIESTINPETRKLAAATLTSNDFWAHPVLGAALKTTGMLPSVAALAIPGGLLADATAATMAAAAGGGLINAGAGLDEFYKKLDAMPDKELQEQSPKYKAIREVMDEEDARKTFNRQAQSWGPAINAILGAAATAVGPAGVAARGMAAGGKKAVLGATEDSALKAAGLAAAEGAAGNALQAGASDVTSQQAEQEAGMQKEFDRARAANAALEGGALGGLLGGAVGLVAGGGAHAAPKTVEDVIKPTARAKPPELPTEGPTQPKTGSAQTPPALPPEAAPPNPQNAPTRSERDLGKVNDKTKAPKNAPEVPPPLPVDQAVATAVAANEGASVTATPTEHAALTEGSPNETLDKLNGKAPQTPQAAPLDTGQNVPEKPATFAEQIAQIGTGDRKAVMFPKGTVIPAAMLGGRNLKSINTPRGRFIYDPKLTRPAEITKLSAAGRENELLGLGPVSKPEAVARADAGETPVAVTERTPAGTEVKSAAGTTATVPEQRASLEAQKTPGNVVAVETPENVIQMRTGNEPPRTGRILPNLTQTAETVPLRAGGTKVGLAAKHYADTMEAYNKAKAEAIAAGKEPPPEPEPPPPEEKVSKGKNYSAKEAALRDENIAKAQRITDKHAPNVEAEREYLRVPEVRDVVIARAQAMLEDAKKVGLRIQGQLKKSEKGNAASDHPSIQILRAAKDLEAVASKNKQGAKRTEATQKFAEAERLIRGGHSEEMIATRREEGDARFKQGPKGDEVNAAYVEEAPKEDLSGATPDVVDTKSVSKDDVATTVQVSAKGAVRGVEAPSEERVIRTKEGHETKEQVAKAASGEKLSSDAKAKLIAEMNAKLKQGAPERAPTKVKAAQEINLNPSEAQKLAGNYKKGHRRVEGLDFTIENPKGAVRRGVGEDGKPWEVRMPADYGYLRSTKGADGDHVDAYDLRSGKRNFVVDQLDHRTGEFDEHKVILRAPDEHAAVEAYKRAFSDGHGEDRLGNLHEVTTPELKDWLKTADTTKPITEHVLGEEPVYSPPEQGERTVSDTLRLPEGGSVKAIRSDYLANELERFDLSKTPGVGGTLARFFQSRLKKIAEHSDTIVHYVTKEAMAKLHDVKDAEATPYGLHWIDHSGTSHIAISDEVKDQGLAHQGLTHVLLHEAVHSVTVRELRGSASFRKDINSLMRIAADWMEHPNNAPHVELLYGDATRYAFTNEAEFVAEAFSNAKLQEVLSMIPMNDTALAQKLGLNQRSMSVWDVFRGYVRKIVEKVTGGAGPQFETVLDGIMRVGERIERQHNQFYVEPRAKTEGTVSAANAVHGEALRMVDDAVERVKNYVADARNNTAERTPKVLKLRTFDNIAQIADHYFEENNPVRKIHEAIETMRVTAEKIFAKSEPLVRELVTLRAKNPEQFRELNSLLHDATVANVHPDVSLSDVKNAHLGKNRVVGAAVWAKAQHPELARRYRALPEDFKKAYHDVVKHYTDTQNKMSLGIINNQILKLMGIDDAALADRIHLGTITDADRASLGANLDVIEKAGELSKIEGPYVPLIRRGDHVVKADRKVAQPSNSKKIAPNEFEFKTEKEATDYAKSSDLRTTLKKVWVDEKTGELHQVDPATGKEHRMSAEDLDSVARYRVEVSNRHVEFVQGRRAAEARAAELAQDAGFEVHKVVPRAFEPGGRQAVELSTSLSNLVKKLEKSDAYKSATPTQQATLRRSIEEASLASHGSTRVSSRALPRRSVAGYSEDAVQGLVDYGASSSRYLAKLEHGADLEAGLKEMQEQIARDHSKTGQYARTAISNEVRQRVEGDNGYQQGGKLSPIIKRALSISFIDKLGSPAYSVINAMQPGMVTMPYLSGRHGVGRAFAALGKAYSDVGAGGIVKSGLAETGRRAVGKGKPEDFTARILKNATPDERAMFDAHFKVGTMDPEAGLEIGHIVRETSGVGGKLDTGLNYLEQVTREMPRAIESINRAVTALAAYRLERARGATHDAAVQYSKDAVNNTQFNYSPTNSPALFNHPLLKIALQFKKYGQGMYQLIGTQIGQALRNERPGDRAQAVKTLITLAATHTAVAGALGLPTEPFKYLLMSAHALGLTQLSWADIEDKIRHEAAGVLGKTGGEVVTRGLPRLFNVDLSRAGLDSVTSFGEPRKDKEADVKAWLFDSLAGPVVSLGGDWIKGVNQITNGDFEKAAENLIPLKAASDSLRAYRQYTEGKKSQRGTQTMTPYTPTEASLRVLGFGSGREAEVGASASAYYRQSEAQKEARAKLVDAWAQGKPSEKSAAWGAIVKWNKSVPAEAKIAPKELTDKAKRDAKASQTDVRGIHTNKRDKRFLDEGAVYNTR